MSRAEKAFIAFSGLKGAVPVLLAAFAVIGGVAGRRADLRPRVHRRAHVGAGQGTLVPFVARSLGIPMRLQDRLPWELSVRVGSEPTGAREHRVAAGSRADGMALADLPLGDDAWVTLLVRDGDALQPDPEIELRAGDRLLILADSDRDRTLSATFAASASAR